MHSAKLASERPIPASCLETNFASDLEAQRRQSQDGSVSHTEMANTILVADGHEAQLISATGPTHQQDLDAQRMALIRQTQEQICLSRQARMFIARATRATTAKQYDDGWRKWANGVGINSHA